MQDDVLGKSDAKRLRSCKVSSQAFGLAWKKEDSFLLLVVLICVSFGGYQKRDEGERAHLFERFGIAIDRLGILRFLLLHRRFAAAHGLADRWLAR